ncbi:hypothetical protein, partial [Rhizobium leguminosarum]|uniref:hypothetical protein n=1 Tax=Rhizobium leguminosarum TaxID=384 RepID=UPI001C978C35
DPTSWKSIGVRQNSNAKRYGSNHGSRKAGSLAPLLQFEIECTRLHITYRIILFMELRYATRKLERKNQFCQSSANASQRMKLNGGTLAIVNSYWLLKEFEPWIYASIYPTQ